MFVLSVLEDHVEVLPQFLGRGQEARAVMRCLQEKFVDRVVRDLGLGIWIFDILNLGDAMVFQSLCTASEDPELRKDLLASQGAVYMTVKFRLIVFRPFADEILEGVIRDADDKGIYISLTFFSDVLVPYSNLMQPCTFDGADRTWVWTQNSGDGFSEPHNFFYDIGQPIRFRVVEVVYSDDIKMQVVGAADMDGLGCLEWWKDCE